MKLQKYPFRRRKVMDLHFVVGKINIFYANNFINHLIIITLQLLHISFVNLNKTKYHEILQSKFFGFIQRMAFFKSYAIFFPSLIN